MATERQRIFSYEMDEKAKELKVFPAGDKDGEPARVYGMEDIPKDLLGVLALEGVKKLMSQESATEGGTTFEEAIASYDATFERLKTGVFRKPRESGERAPQASKVMTLTLQHVLKAKGHSPDKWMSLAVNLGLAGPDGLWKADAATQRDFLSEKARALPLFADALAKAKAGEPAVEIEEIDIGL